MKKIPVVLTVLIILFGAVCTPVKSSKTFWDPIVELNKSQSVDLKPPTISADNGIVDIAWSESSEGDSDIYLSSFRNESFRSKVEISQDYGQTLNTQNGNNESQWNANIIIEDEHIHAVWLGNRDGDAWPEARRYYSAFIFCLRPCMATTPQILASPNVADANPEITTSPKTLVAKNAG